jgi:hypothetical protein
VRTTGLLLGLAIALLAVLSWRIPASGGALGADLTFVATSSGELDLSPAGRFLTARGLAPGAEPVVGDLEVSNQTGRRLTWRVRALPSTRELDRLAVVDLSTGGRVLYRGALGGLRRHGRRAFRLGSGASRALTARVWLRRGAGNGWRGRIVDVQLEVRAVGEEGRR